MAFNTVDRKPVIAIPHARGESTYRLLADGVLTTEQLHAIADGPLTIREGELVKGAIKKAIANVLTATGPTSVGERSTLTQARMLLDAVIAVKPGAIEVELGKRPLTDDQKNEFRKVQDDLRAFKANYANLVGDSALIFGKW